MRQSATYHIADIRTFKKKLLHWSAQYEKTACCMGESTIQNGQYMSYDMVVGVDAISELSVDTDCFNSLRQYYDQKKDWLFGYLCYDLKNEIEDLRSENSEHLHFPLLYFFQPKWVFQIRNDEIKIHFPEDVSRKEMQKLFQQIMQMTTDTGLTTAVGTKRRISKHDYQHAFDSLMKNIARGDIYEVNFCQEYYAQDVAINPLQTFENLYALSHAPFSVYFRNDDQYLMCASPERFVKKDGQKLISQPIKGTRPRALDATTDQALVDELASCQKEQSENVMIVDLVRNDLSKTAQKGSVRVEELYGVYSFKQVHQMISTITSELVDDTHWVDAVKSVFPMGSMTGAPKIRAMQLIDDMEVFKRGLYSGSVGFVTPEEDFDFNVVIRSILYNAKQKYVSFAVGSAITSKASFEQEYNECEIKAKAMLEVLNA